jgi:primosomal protein N' (replication factor Y)
MRCHSCSFSTKPPNSCPDCKNATVVFKSVGTKAIAEEVDRLFPAAKVMRFDNDNKKSERIEQHYDSVKAGEVDIVVGTQTLAKGLDLPKLSTIGVIVADTSLFLPDFSAQERTYQLLHQVLGRVNRGHQDSHIVIQTYQPESDLLKAVLKKDWHYFYNKELDERKKFAFPPYFYLLKITCKRATSQSAQKAAEDFAKTLSDIHNIKVEGPAPSFHEKSQGKYIWQIIIKSKERRILLDVIKKLPNGWSYDIDPMNLL